MNPSAEPLLPQLLTLFFALLGLLVILTRGRVFGWLLRALLAPVRLVLGAVMLGAVGLAALLFMGVNLEPIAQLWQTFQGAAPAVGGGAQPSANQGERLILSQYKPLSQKNLANYRGGEAWATAKDTSAAGDVVERRSQTCLATIYTILARAHGAPGAMVDDYYAGGAVQNQPLSGMGIDELPYAPEKIIAELKSGYPVILVGEFSGGRHYLLVIGYERDADDRLRFLFNDPLPGRQIWLDGEAGIPQHPEWPSGTLRITHMRYARL